LIFNPRSQASFTRAIVRPPGANFAAGLRTVDLGLPNHQLALLQHESYCRALERCGLELTQLEPDERHPDSTFVEDTAVLTERGAILTRPGALSRRGEVAAIGAALNKYYEKSGSISEPGTVDGGDICEAGSHFLIGISRRTNEAGAAQLAEQLRSFGYTFAFVDIRGVPGILHLKSGIASLDDHRLLVIEELCKYAEFRDFQIMRVPSGEEYAANCIYVNEVVLIAAGCPRTEAMLQARGYRTIALEMSEFRKMDGGLSCLSLRF
jgi:dimethylargininase